MRDAIAAAGLPLACQPHGLRKTAGKRLAEVGCSAHEIMSILGHKTLAETEKYTRDASQRTLATSAISKLEGSKREQAPQTDNASLGKRRKPQGNQ
jgi:integrase